MPGLNQAAPSAALLLFSQCGEESLDLAEKILF